MGRAAAQQDAGDHHRVRAGQDQLERVHGRVGAAGGPQGEVRRRAQDRRPPQGQAHLGRVAQLQARHDVERLQVDVRLEEPVEEHHAGRPGPFEAFREMGRGRQVGSQLDAERDRDRLGHGPDLLGVERLDVLGRQRRVGRDVQDVQLDRVGAGRLDLTGIALPALGRDAVQAGDHRDAEGRAHRLHPSQVAVRSGVVALQLGEVPGGLVVALAPEGVQPVQLHLLVLDLLLEQRGQDHRAGAGLLELARRRDVAGERGRRGDQRAPQVQAQVRAG